MKRTALALLALIPALVLADALPLPGTKSTFQTRSDVPASMKISSADFNQVTAAIASMDIGSTERLRKAGDTMTGALLFSSAASLTMSGATSGTVQLLPTAAAGTGTVLTLPATTGTLVSTASGTAYDSARLGGVLASGYAPLAGVTGAWSVGGALSAASATINGSAPWTAATLPVFVPGLAGGGVAQVASNSAMEIGRYLDFHASNADTSDYSARLESPSAGTLTVGHSGGTIATFTSTGLGIGISPSTPLDVAGRIRTNDSMQITGGGDLVLNNATNNAFISIKNTGASGSNLLSLGSDVTVTGAVSATGGSFGASASPTEALNVRGALRVETASKAWHLAVNGSSQFMLTESGAADRTYVAAGATSWSAVSDERFKTSLRPFANAAAALATWRSGVGRYLTDAGDVERSFLIAQDVQRTLPQAVDASNPDRLGLSYTDTIPLIVAGVNEHTASLAALASRVAALEGARN